jgi:DNA-3-methyladenine glycosylase I
MEQKTRCKWCNPKNPKYIKYHDKEWCKPNFNEKYLFEMLILESFQAGLSWECVLNKREDFRKAYDNFEIDKICKYDDKKIQELMQNEKIIRNKLKIKASINNAQIFKEIQKEYGKFNKYLTTFTKEKIIYETNKTTNNLSDKISKDLQKRGMKFVGSTIIYSYLQAIGAIYSHDKECFMYKEEKSDNKNSQI